jgi:signal transduction histidine kinase
MRTLVGRLVVGGLLGAVIVGAAGLALERARFGASDDEALLRVETELRRQFDGSADALRAMAARVVSARGAIELAQHDPATVSRLFDIVSDALPADQAGRTGITVFDTAARPLAWAGQVMDLTKERISGPSAVFVVPGALGPRLVRVEPVVDPERPGSARVATVVVEQSLAGLQRTPGLASGVTVVSTSLAPVSIRTDFQGDGPAVGALAGSGSSTFVIPSPTGGPLVEAEVSRATLSEARGQWRARTWAATALVVVIALLLGAGPLLDVRKRARTARTFLAATAAIAAILIVARSALLWIVSSVAGPQPFGSPAYVLLTALTAVGFVALAADMLARRRVARPRPRLWIRDNPRAVGDYRVAAVYMVSGGLAAASIAAYERFLQEIVARTNLDVVHFSLHPFSIRGLSVGFGLLLLHAAVVWGAAMVAYACGVFWRRPRRWDLRATATAGWLTGAAGAIALIHWRFDTIPLLPWCVAISACGVCAAAFTRLSQRSRRSSQAARLVALLLSLAVPALAMYPSLFFLATAAKERLIAATYAPQATSQRKDLQDRLYQTLDQIDALPNLADYVAGPSRLAPTIDRAFAVWANTALATYRLTSSVELYSSDGGLISRFALLPEYSTPRREATSCNWEVFEEVLPFGATKRHVPQASRGICEKGVIRGSIVVRVMLDYRTLPFISSQNPYLESLRPETQPASEGLQGNDVEFSGYGWSRAPTYVSGTGIWPLTDNAFARAVASREAFWTTLVRDDERFRVYLTSDRGGIYALGYPAVTWFGHLVSLAELVVLVGALYVVLVVGSALFTWTASTQPASGRALLREFRSSFYRKLFLAYVAGAVVPVAILAFAVRTYFAAQARAGMEDAAAKTATVAQRLVEDYATLTQQQLGPAGPPAIDDQIMVFVSQAIDQDVNLFERSGLEATSQRDLFASRLLSSRTPSLVYRRIVLDRLPTFVSVEPIADTSYMEAAAPIRAGGREEIVTVPLPLRKLEIEGQIDTLDRQVIFGAVLFSLLGAAIGYWMAERIADPINRLSYATRRIARGDLNAHIAVASSDELGRLVKDFNRMADDLKRQRADLERTQRLEAWADMARQVAHDIKNPLTPIQLSAEHAQRVNLDRGRPLSPILDECVHAILTQVLLLRQISAEFSSFASSPTARPEPAPLPALIEEVVAPYRTALAGRITIDVSVPGALPPALIDRTLFARAITNVIENALHAMPGHGRLTIRAAWQQPNIVIDLIDTGVGMEPDALAHMFEPYFSTKASGTGLGLTIAKRNIELIGGTISLSSARGVGTTVTVTVPAVESGRESAA